MPLRRLSILVCAFSVLAAVAAAAPKPSPPTLTAQQLLHDAQAYLVSPAALDDQANQFLRQDAVQLYHLRFEQVVPNGLSALLVQRVFQIRTPQGADWFAPDNLWYDSVRGRFQLIRAQVWRRHRHHGAYSVVGHGTDLGNLPGFGVGTEPRRIGLPTLHVGDRVSVLYAVLPSAGPEWALLDGHFIGNMFAFRDSFATEQVRYVLAAHAPMAVSAAGLPAPEQGTGPDGLRTWSWQASDQAAFFQSNGGPAITDVSPFVQVSGFTTWAAMAAWYSLLLRQRAHVSPALLAELRALAAAPVAAGTRLERNQHRCSPADRTVCGFDPRKSRTHPINAGYANADSALPSSAAVAATVGNVWAYLSQHLSYRGVEHGVHAYVPAPVAEVFRSGQGDCKDGALLLVTWLRALGIEADVALVRTPSMGMLAPANARGQVAATMAAFDHALVYIPATGQWIDTTAPHRPDTDLPRGDLNSLALIVRRGQQALVRVRNRAVLAAAATAPATALQLASGHPEQP